MERVRFIIHQGKEILLIDHSGCTAEQVMENMDECLRLVTSRPPGSVLTLSDLTGLSYDRRALARMKEVAALDKPYVRRAAVVGIGGLPKVLYDAVSAFSGRRFPAFSTREEALDWLVSAAEGASAAS